MPDQPKTPIRAVRVPSDLWEALRIWAEAHGTDRSSAIRESIRHLIASD